MKKLLLVFGAALITASTVLAQTNSQDAGNMPNTDNTGYAFNFNTPSTVPDVDALNCKNTHVPTFASNGYTLTFTPDANAIKIDVAANRTDYFSHWKFTTGNCSSTSIDISAVSTVKIRVRAKASAATTLFAELNGTVNNQLARNGQEEAKNITTDWAIYEYTITQFGTLDKTQISGFSVGVGDLANAYTVWIDWIEVNASSQVTDNAVVAGVGQATLPSSVNYFPNPSNSNIKVENMDVTSLKLMNLSGSVVRETSNSSVSVEGLNPGMYFLQINGYKPVKVTVE